MHFEILVEDASGELLLGSLLPKILGKNGNPHTWRTHAYKGIGRVPPGSSRQDRSFETHSSGPTTEDPGWIRQEPSRPGFRSRCGC